MAAMAFQEDFGRIVFFFNPKVLLPEAVVFFFEWKEWIGISEWIVYDLQQMLPHFNQISFHFSRLFALRDFIAVADGNLKYSSYFLERGQEQPSPDRFDIPWERIYYPPKKACLSR